MERSARPQRTLSKQAEIDEDEEITTALVSSDEKPDLNNETNSNDHVSLNINNGLVTHTHRSRSHSKVKLLVRSHAMREETSPPPDPPESCSPTPINTNTVVVQTNNNNNISNNNSNSSNNNNNVINNNNSISNNNNNNNSSNNNNLTVSRQSRLRREGSSQGSFDSSNWSPCISRGSSTEQYTDSTGVDLEQFIAETLNRNQKDRMLLLKIEHDLVSLAKDSKRNVHKFPPMSSYQRMLVHRAAAYFGMEHNVDPSGHSVVVNTTKATRIPDSRFKQHLRDDLLFPEEPRRSILKRDSSSFEETGSFKSAENGDSRRSKSFEEREEEYEKARRRIFTRDDDGSFEELPWCPEGTWNGSDLENSNRLRMNCSESHRPTGRLLKVESYESKDTLRANSLRLTVSKSYSFGGYDQSQPTSRVLVKQDSGSSMSSRLSPSSSGYKSQSQRSDTTISATPSPTATPHPHINQLSSQSGDNDPDTGSEPTVVWAVTNIASVPPGSVLINPQTGQAYTNSDGSIYHFDPENPPKVESAAGTSETILLPPSPPSPTPAVAPAPPPPPPPLPPPPPPPPPPPQPSTSCPTRVGVTRQCSIKHEDYGTSASHILPLPNSSHNNSSNNNNNHSHNHHHHHHHNNNANNSNTMNNNPARETEKMNTHPMPHQSSVQLLPVQPPPPPSLHPPPPPPPPPPLPPPMHPPAPIHYTHSHYPPPAPVYPFPATPAYNLVLQPPDNQIPTGQQPPMLMYTPGPPSTTPYEHRIPVADTSELSYNMMGLNIADGTVTRNLGSASVDSRAGPPLVYWSHQLPQIQGQTHTTTMPVFYAPSGGQSTAARYQPVPSGVPPPYQPVAQPERNVGYSGNDCNLAYPQSSLHMFYNPQCNNGSPPTSQGGSVWGSGGNGPPLVTLQYPAAPTPPQSLCTQYTVYSNGYGMGVGGCYQSHYSNSSNPQTPQPSLTLPPIFRPPNIQMQRNAARASPGMKDRNEISAHIPMFGLPVMPGNTPRLPFGMPAGGNKPTPNHHIRKQRPNSGRPMLVASQQPAPFAMQPSPVPGYFMSTVAP